MANSNLTSAKRAKNDEFYTQYHDIEKEVAAYVEFNPDVFRNKTVFLPCDDPEWSNFTKFFAQNFQTLGLKKLVSTSYAADSKKLGAYTPSLFETESEKFDRAKTAQKGKLYTLTGDKTGDGRIDVNDLVFDYLKGDGDFGSKEVRALRDKADIIITNPPFSLFREFLAWVVEADKQFLIIGNMNAITYKEVFPLIKANKMWLGNKTSSQQMFLEATQEYTENVMASKPQGMWWRMIDGKPLIGIHTALWFTNIDHGRRHLQLQLMSMADNLRFNKKLKGTEKYDRYHNYDAIEVPFTDAIPSDYEDLMGVPISYLDKHNPDQFEIIGSSRTLGERMSEIAARGSYMQGGPRFYLDNGNGTYERLYDRIVIRRCKS